MLCTQVSHPHQGCLALGLGRENQQFSQNCKFGMETEMPQLTGLKRAVALLSLGLKRVMSLLPLLSLPSLPLATPPAKSHPRETLPAQKPFLFLGVVFQSPFLKQD